MDTADTDATVTLYRPTGEKELARTDYNPATNE